MNKQFAAKQQAAQNLLNASPEQVKKGLELHRKLFVCDNFGFLPSSFSEKARLRIEEMCNNNATHEEVRAVMEDVRAISHAYDPASREAFLEALNVSGINMTILTCGSELDLHHSLCRISRYIRVLDLMHEHLGKVTCVADIDRIAREGKFGIVCSTNGAPAHGGLLHGIEAHEFIDIFYSLGIRIMHLTYNRRNWVGDGCYEPNDAGLSLHGIDVVHHLNRIGMVVDIPHSGHQTTMDAAKHSRAPIMATHTSCKAVFNHPRAKSDDALKAIADTGGLVGIYILNNFLGKSGDINTFFEHIDHAVNLIGPDHVAIGTDKSCQLVPLAGTNIEKIYPKPSPYTPFGWYKFLHDTRSLQNFVERGPIPQESSDSLDWINWPYFTVGLVKLGYSEENIAKILGKNFRRVWSAVEKESERPA